MTDVRRVHILEFDCPGCQSVCEKEFSLPLDACDCATCIQKDADEEIPHYRGTHHRLCVDCWGVIEVWNALVVADSEANLLAQHPSVPSS
jgi:hypothetical protein